MYWIRFQNQVKFSSQLLFRILRSGNHADLSQNFSRQNNFDATRPSAYHLLDRDLERKFVKSFLSKSAIFWFETGIKEFTLIAARKWRPTLTERHDTKKTSHW